MGAKKNFVLDTNVILHDYKCIENFQENEMVVCRKITEKASKRAFGKQMIINSL
ncbi:MAG: PIN domain-containing protein [Parabacteroides sp.]|nr:PIN domain-containing protein [Parabacteroides sp.]MDU1011460.1 PIN domain-containing protein [Parabacteroides sp.]